MAIGKVQLVPTQARQGVMRSSAAGSAPHVGSFAAGGTSPAASNPFQNAASALSSLASVLGPMLEKRDNILADDAELKLRESLSGSFAKAMNLRGLDAQGSTAAWLADAREQLNNAAANLPHSVRHKFSNSISAWINASQTRLAQNEYNNIRSGSIDKAVSDANRSDSLELSNILAASRAERDAELKGTARSPDTALSFLAQSGIVSAADSESRFKPLVDQGFLSMEEADAMAVKRRHDNALSLVKTLSADGDFDAVDSIVDYLSSDNSAARAILSTTGLSPEELVTLKKRNSTARTQAENAKAAADKQAAAQAEKAQRDYEDKFITAALRVEPASRSNKDLAANALLLASTYDSLATDPNAEPARAKAYAAAAKQLKAEAASYAMSEKTAVEKAAASALKEQKKRNALQLQEEFELGTYYDDASKQFVRFNTPVEMRDYAMKLFNSGSIDADQFRHLMTIQKKERTKAAQTFIDSLSDTFKTKFPALDISEGRAVFNPSDSDKKTFLSTDAVKIQKQKWSYKDFIAAVNATLDWGELQKNGASLDELQKHFMESTTCKDMENANQLVSTSEAVKRMQENNRQINNRSIFK